MKNAEGENKSRHLHWVESDDRHYIAIGKVGSPWDQRLQIRLPMIVCKFLNLKF